MSIASVDQDSPLFSDMDIETLHNQLLEAAASGDSATTQPPADIWGHGLQSSDYIDIRGFDKRASVITPENATHTVDIPIALLVKNSVSFGECMNELGRFTYRTDTSIWVRIDNKAIRERVSPHGDVDFAFVRPQAVEYEPVIPADYTTAIPSIFSQMDKQLDSIMQDDGSEDPPDVAVSCATLDSSSPPSARRIASLPQRSSSVAFHPRTPPLRVVDRNVDEDHKRAPRKRKAQATPLRAAKKAKEAILISPTPNKSKGRAGVVAQAVGEFVCPEEGCGKVCRRIGDLNRHRQSRAHQLPSFPCPSGCGKIFSRKDAAKRHSETDKCPMSRVA